MSAAVPHVGTGGVMTVERRVPHAGTMERHVPPTAAMERNAPCAAKTAERATPTVVAGRCVEPGGARFGGLNNADGRVDVCIGRCRTERNQRCGEAKDSDRLHRHSVR